jgi:hypothetical protein
MAKKETVKKTTAKKTTKKVAAKKVEKIEEVVINEPVQTEEVVEVEKPELNYENIYKESDKSIVVENEPEDDKVFQEQVMKHVASEILVEKNNNLDELLSMNEEEVVEKAKEKITEIKKVNNDRVNQRIDSVFGYLWNGQEIDY